MTRKLLLWIIFTVAINTVLIAQNSVTPEIPRNYKPKPKDLLPMPDSLTQEQIFPVLGTYTLADKKGHSYTINILPDPESKGIVWVNGLPEGKIKADLRVSPATYKILAQNALPNESPDTVIAVQKEEEITTHAHKAKSQVIAGKSVGEGTLYLDTTAQMLYINIGNKYNEDVPTDAFPEIALTEETNADSSVINDNNEEMANAIKPAKKVNKPSIKGVTYTGKKELSLSQSTETVESVQASDKNAEEGND